MGVTKQEGKNVYVLKRLIDIGLAVILAGTAVFGVKYITKDFTDLERKSGSDSTISTPDKNNLDSSDIYVTEFTDNEKINAGSLIVVNDTFEYKGNEDDLVSFYDVREEKNSDFYTVFDKDVKIRKEVADPLDSMLKAFHDETGHSDIQVDSGYRSVQSQQELYDASDDKSNVAAPGYSDYHTGYSIDLNVVDDEGNSLDFDGTGDYQWFEKNCYKYGFIVRFPEGKSEQTGLDYRPWHFRYVGFPHAYYMQQNNLCLEEYVQQIQTYKYDGEHLKFDDFDGKQYEIYYYPQDENSSSTMLAVPSEKEYTVSGNNVDGYIVTVLEGSASADDSSSTDESSKDSESKTDSSSSDESKTDNADTAQSKKVEQ
ncbi:MAG: D-alanyl-D-alanine carboxypeptidase family protein [Oscillospiraceae bacterium]